MRTKPQSQESQFLQKTTQRISPEIVTAMTFCGSCVPLLLLLIVLVSECESQNKVDWKPVDPSLLSLKAPTVEKDAGAEALFWEVYVEDKGNHADLLHYIRVKIFNEHGQESQSRIELAYAGKNKIEDLAERTIMSAASR